MTKKHKDRDDENTPDEKDHVEQKTGSEIENQMTRDDLLRTELGEFGWFQLRYALIVIIPIMFSAVRNDYILSTAPIPHRCRIPECGENSKLHSYGPDWILNAVPESNSGFSSCSKYAPIDSGINGSLDYCPASLFDQANVISCKDYVYENEYGIVYDFDLGCNEWLRALAGSIGNIGLLLGLPLSGFISDRFGRKVALVFNIFSLGLVGVIRTFSVNYTMYMLLQLAQTIFGSSVYTTAIVLATELVGPKYRFVGVTLVSVYSLGQVMIGGVYWLLRDWRYATLALCIPCLFMIVYYWLLSESIRWLLVKKKYDEARKIIETAARLNKKSVSDKSMQALLKPQHDPLPRSGVTKAGMIRTILRSRILLTRVCTTPIWWIAGTFVYYGLSINSTGLSDTIYLNYILVCVAEIPGCFIGAFLIHTAGRKVALSAGFLFSALCNLLFVLIPNGNNSVVRLLIYLFGKVGATMAMASLFVYTSELYPTEYRHTLLAFSSTVGRLGAIVAPLTPGLKQYWHAFPSVLFSGMGFLAGALVFTQPETLGAKLPDTFAEAEMLGKPDNTVKSERVEFQNVVKIASCIVMILILNAVPESKSGLSSCSRYAPIDSGINGSLEYCPASLFDQANVVSCKDYVYANEYGIVYDFDLGCNEWLRALAGSVGDIGLLLGLPLTGFISDHFGRKVALVFNIFSLGLFGVIRCLSANYTMYMLLQLAQAIFGSNVYTTAIVLGTELVGPKYRAVGLTLLSVYSLGQVMIGGVYWLLRYWRYATLALYIPCLFMIVHYWLLSESIRWLLVKKEYDKAKKIIETAARLNKKTISDQSMEALLKPQHDPLPRSGVTKAGIFRTILRSRILLTRVCTTPVWWMAATFVYYGLSINSTGLSDTIYLNYILVCVVDIPGGLFGAFLIHTAGRKIALSAGFLFSASCNLLFTIIPNGSTYVVRLIIYLFGKVGVSVAMSSLFLYTSELYPTEYRHTLLAFSSTVGRLGAIAAPLTPGLKQYWHALPSVLFSGMGFLAGALVFTQPETLGAKLPDTFAEAELLGKPDNTVKSEH